MTALACEVCERRARFRFTRGETSALLCLRHAVLHPPVFRRALQVAGVVGTILFLINQADVVFSGRATALVIGKSVLTYLVPFSVSTYSALEINRVG